MATSEAAVRDLVTHSGSEPLRSLKSWKVWPNAAKAPIGGTLAEANKDRVLKQELHRWKQLYEHAQQDVARLIKENRTLSNALMQAKLRLTDDLARELDGVRKDLQLTRAQLRKVESQHLSDARELAKESKLRISLHQELKENRSALQVSLAKLHSSGATYNKEDQSPGSLARSLLARSKEHDQQMFMILEHCRDVEDKLLVSREQASGLMQDNQSLRLAVDALREDMRRMRDKWKSHSQGCELQTADIENICTQMKAIVELGFARELKLDKDGMLRDIALQTRRNKSAGFHSASKFSSCGELMLSDDDAEDSSMGGARQGVSIRNFALQALEAAAPAGRPHHPGGRVISPNNALASGRSDADDSELDCPSDPPEDLHKTAPPPPISKSGAHYRASFAPKAPSVGLVPDPLSEGCVPKVVYVAKRRPWRPKTLPTNIILSSEEDPSRKCPRQSEGQVSMLIQLPVVKHMTGNLLVGQSGMMIAGEKGRRSGTNAI